MYQTKIAQLLGDPSVCPAHLEEWMRLKFGTLDHLSPDEFAQEVQEAVRVVRAADPDDNQKLAASYGLRIGAQGVEVMEVIPGPEAGPAPKEVGHALA